MIPAEPEFDQLRTLISNGEMRAAIERLVEFARASGDRNLFNEAILQSRRLVESERRERQGRLTQENASSTYQTIMHAILQIIDEAERSQLPRQGKARKPLGHPSHDEFLSPPTLEHSRVKEEDQANSKAVRSADVFISHASEDKSDVADPLAELLVEAGYSVWYDSFTLVLGDSLYEAINRGLSSCRFGVVILSRWFFEKPWPLRELASLLALETADGRKRILPVLHQVSPMDVAERMPLLADRLGVSTSLGLDEVARQIICALEI